jgi:hypothetical protein
MPIKIKRREFVKRAAYAAPVILTLKAMPAFAAAGSGKDRSKGQRPSQRDGSQTESNSEGHNRDSFESNQSNENRQSGGRNRH